MAEKQSEREIKDKKDGGRTERKKRKKPGDALR